MYISYDYYRIFYYVAKYQSFTKAANALFSNQPNVTRAIKKLEQELGCTLFARSNRSVTLTPEGEKLYAHVSIALEHIQAAETELSLDKSLQSGTVSIGASEIALHCSLLPVLKEFKRLYPGIHIHVTNHSTPQAINALKNGLVDFAVVTTPVDLPKNMQHTILKKIREIPIAGTAYAFLKKNPLSLSELAHYPYICLGTQTKTYEFYSQWFSQKELEFSPDIEAATSDQILPMVKNDLGIGFVPEDFLQHESEKSGIYKLHLTDEIPARSVCLVKQTGHSLSIAAKVLETMLRNSQEI